MTTREEQKTEITKWLEGEKDQMITGYLPASADEREFLAGLRLVILGNDEVRKEMETETGRNNLACEFRKAASWGISVNPADKFVSFYPQDGKIIAHLDAAGLIEKIIRDGAALECRSLVIYENDGLEIEETDEGDKFTLRKSLKDRGEISGFLSYIKLHDGTTRIHYLSVDQAREWGNRFGKGKKGLKPMWKYNFEGAGQKTAIRQLLTKIRVSGFDAAADDEPETVDAGPAEVIDPKAPADANAAKAALAAQTDEPEPDADGVVPDAEQGDDDLFGGSDG